MSTRLAKTASSLCSSCGRCGLETKLFDCGGCRAARYCSPECQRKAWKVHKVLCMHSQERSSSMSSLTKPGHCFGGLSPADSKTALRKWIDNYRNVITWAAAFALELKRHPEHSDTHVFYIMLNLTPKAKAGNTTKPRNMFYVQAVNTIEKKVLVERRPSLGKIVVEADAEYASIPKKDRLRDNMAITLVLCGLQVVWIPCHWSQNEVNNLPETHGQQWREVFLYNIAIQH